MLRHGFDSPSWEAVIRRDWSRWCAALGAFIMMYTLFKPWLIGKSMDGEVHVNAFGRVQVDTTLVGLWSRHPPAFAVATGRWPILAICAGVITIAAIAINYRYRSERLILVATCSSVLGAVFIVATLVYINSRGEALRGIVGQGDALDVGSQVGYIIRAMAGNRVYPVPGLRTVQRFSSTFTGWAYFAAAVSVVSAVGTATQWFTERTATKPAADEAAVPDDEMSPEAENGDFEGYGAESEENRDEPGADNTESTHSRGEKPGIDSGHGPPDSTD